MKKTLLTLTLSVAYYYACAQNTFPASGNVGIGTTNPYTKLQVNAGADINLGIQAGQTDGTAAQLNAFNNTGALSVPMELKASKFNFTVGNVGIGTTSPNGALDVNGAILVPGSTTNTMTRPAVGIARIIGEIAGYRGASPTYDDGFLRLSAGGGTSTIAKTYIDLSGYSTVPDMDRNITLGTEAIERMRITNSGNVGIGTTNPDSKLAVNGTIHSKEVKVDLTGWADYVFNPEYQLSSLSEVKTYIDQNHHLPEMPSEQEIVKDGLNLGEMNRMLVKKVEELTLYLIEKDDKDKEKDAKLQSQQQQINQLKQKLDSITKTTNKN